MCQVIGSISGSSRITLVDRNAPPDAQPPVDLDLEKALFYFLVVNNITCLFSCPFFVFDPVSLYTRCFGLSEPLLYESHCCKAVLPFHCGAMLPYLLYTPFSMPTCMAACR